MSSLLLTWMEKYVPSEIIQIAPLLMQFLKNKVKLHFITLNYIPNYILHPKLWIFVQVNNKLGNDVQSITKIMIYGAKCNWRYSLRWLSVFSLKFYQNIII